MDFDLVSNYNNTCLSSDCTHSHRYSIITIKHLVFDFCIVSIKSYGVGLHVYEGMYIRDTFLKLIMKICIVDLNINFRYKRNVLMPIITHITTSLFGVLRAAAVSVAHVTRSDEKSSSESI